MTTKIVIGAGFGDEGKGMFTNYLCSLFSNNKDLVVRFNGGQQAGHTVVKNNFRHVFSSFGSGTLNGNNTYWSKHCTINPQSLLNELAILLVNKISPLVYIDSKCPITTPLDINYNKLAEFENKHGSCGVGFGATIERELNLYSLTFEDLFFPSILKMKLEGIREYYNNKTEMKDYLRFGEIDFKEFIEDCLLITGSPYIKKTYEIPENYEYIFEGAQGLLLDQNYGFYPNVTWSDTGTKNILNSFSKCLDENTEVYLVSRAYQTRHGNGFMTNENIPHNITPNIRETNIKNAQGDFRRTLLDVSLLEYAIKKDDYIRSTKNLNLVITCLDHIKNELRFTYKNKILSFSNENEYIEKIGKILNINSIYICSDEEGKTIQHLTK